MSPSCFQSLPVAARTVAGNEGAIEYLAATAGLQQWKQAALAYALLGQSQRPLSEEELCGRAEALLATRLGLRVRFAADEALAELRRFGLLVEAPPPAARRGAAGGGVAARRAEAPGGAAAGGAVRPAAASEGQAHAMAEAERPGVSAAPAAHGSETAAGAAANGAPAAAPANGAAAAAAAPPSRQLLSREPVPLYSVVAAEEGCELLRRHWGRLLETRVADIMEGLA